VVKGRDGRGPSGGTFPLYMWRQCTVCEVLSALSYPGFILSAFHASVLYDICFSVCCIWFSVLCLSCSGLVASTFQVIR